MAVRGGRDPIDGRSPSIVAALLRAGALLNEAGLPFTSVNREYSTAEDFIQSRERLDSELKYNEHWIAIKALVAGVRKHGTYKRYMRAPHREVLAVRGLAQRGKLRTDHPALAFLAKQGDNGVVWHILSYWRPDN